MKVFSIGTMSILKENMMMNFKETEDFKKDCKRLEKKYKSLANDLFEFRKFVSTLPLGKGRHFAVLFIQGDTKIVKARLFCKYLRGSTLRIVYAYDEKKKNIIFLEIYFKGDKVNEDKARIKEYIKNEQRSKSC